MAEEVKRKKRGRPPKVQKEQLSESEDTKQISMTHMTDVQRQMQSIFQKFEGHKLTYSDYLTALGNSFINNPFVQNQRLKTINATIHGSDKQTINSALEAPQENEILLRQESQALYWQSYVYNNLIKINSASYAKA